MPGDTGDSLSMDHLLLPPETRPLWLDARLISVQPGSEDYS
jgi:hypothetical protein